MATEITATLCADSETNTLTVTVTEANNEFPTSIFVHLKGGQNNETTGCLEDCYSHVASVEEALTLPEDAPTSEQDFYRKSTAVITYDSFPELIQGKEDMSLMLQLLTCNYDKFKLVNEGCEEVTFTSDAACS